MFYCTIGKYEFFILILPHKLSLMCNTMKSITVCLPVYNGSEYIGECINSILHQTFKDFELLIVDDGSTDDTCAVIEGFDDPRIKVVRNRHDYIGSLNLMLSSADGKYIARIDADDIMMPDRLEYQYAFMESHPEVDILGGSFRSFGDEDKVYARSGEVSVRELMQFNCVVNPSVMMRRESVLRCGLCYDADFIYAEDYHFWMQAVIGGLCIFNTDKIVIRYRVSSAQTSSIHSFQQYKASKRVQGLLSRWLAREEEKLAESEMPVVPEPVGRLSIIIPFLNEGREVAETVRSIRDTAGDAVYIIVINDQSNDGYDYRGDLAPYNVAYMYNIERKGVAASRDYGVSLCRTPYFLLLDAHMRFYDAGWHERIISLLEADDRRLLCCQTKFLGKDDAGRVYVMDDCPQSYGAYIRFESGHRWPDVNWNLKESCPDSMEEQIPVVLGAGYAASCRYWKHLRGLEGLRSYGSDEPYISMKVWLEGGECLLVKDVVVGHIYRERSPFKRYSADEVYNSLLISYLLFPYNLCCMSNAAALVGNRYTYSMACCMLEEDKALIENLKSYFNRIFTRPFDFFLQKQHELAFGGDKFVQACLQRQEEFAGYVLEHIPDDCGLFEGKAAVMLWMFLYAGFSGEGEWKYRGSMMLRDISDVLLNRSFSWNFRNGACGIGWAVMYLCANNLIEIDDEVNCILDEVDEIVKVLNPHDIADYSLPDGMGGLLAYMSLRLRFPRSCGFDTGFLDELNDSARRLLAESNDVVSCSYAFSFLRSLKNPDELMIVDINEWLRCPLYVPRKQDYWNTSLESGCVGALVKAMDLRMLK